MSTIITTSGYHNFYAANPHMEPCPDCGCPRERGAECGIESCDSNLDRREAVKQLKQVRKALHESRKEQAEKSLITALNLLASDGIVNLDVRQTLYLRKITRQLPQMECTRTHHHTTYSFDIDEEYGVTKLHLTLPTNPSRPGSINCIRPGVHVDESAEWDQSLEEDAEVVEVRDFQAEQWTREGANLVERAKMMKGIE
jgi:hypothetical protein